MSSALSVLEGHALYTGQRRTLGNRMAWYETGIYYDLGDRAVRIDPDGWDVVRAPLVFRRFTSQRPQVAPEQGGELADLLRFTNISAEHVPLLLTYLTAALVPDIPQPIIVVQGPQGSAKSFLFRLLKELLDPSRQKRATFPGNAADFAREAFHHRCYYLDNVTNLPLWLSDSLCRLSTGDAFSRRKLYSDDDDVLLDLQGVAGINGRNLVVTEADLLDRALIFRLQFIEDRDRRSEREMLAEFEAAKPYILGAMFTTLSQAMAIYPTLKTESLPRMADYYEWALAAAVGLGIQDEFAQGFANNIAVQNMEALDASPIAGGLRALMDGRESWQGTATELLTALNNCVDERQQRQKGWPKTPSWLTRRLNEIRPNLEKIGLGTDVWDTPSERVHRLFRREAENGCHGYHAVSGTDMVGKPSGNNFCLPHAPQDASGGGEVVVPNGRQEKMGTIMPTIVGIDIEKDTEPDLMVPMVDIFSSKKESHGEMHDGGDPQPRAPCRCGSTAWWWRPTRPEWGDPGAWVCGVCHPKPPGGEQ